jgi:Tfp pilus assembly protein PilF
MAANYKANSRSKTTAPTTANSLFAGMAPATRQKLLFVLKIIILVEAAFLVFSPALKGTWFGDDRLYILANPLMHDPDRLWKAWFVPGSFIDYYPLEQTVQWYQWQLFGIDSPFDYLVCNLLLHICSGLLLWRLFAKLGLKYAWLGGLLFAIFPLMVDTVANAAELKNTLSLPPLLLALCYWLDYEQTHTRRDYLASLALYLVSMLCKITAFYFGLVILLYAWWKRGRITLRDCLAAAPFLLIGVVLSLMQIHGAAIYGHNTGDASPGPIHLGGIGERLELFGLSLIWYFGHSFLPVNPMPIYPLWDLDPLSPLRFLPWLAIVLVAGYCWYRRHGWGRAVLFALGFFILGLAPFLGLIQVSYMCELWVADHLLYLPIIALIGLAVAGIGGLANFVPARWRPAGFALLAFIVLLVGAQARAYATLFANQQELWRYNLQFSPNSWMAHNNYANELSTRGDFDGAIREYRECLRINPQFDNAQFSLGLCLFKTGDLPNAIDAFHRAIQITPKFHAAQLFLGFALLKSGHADEAIAQFQAFIQAVPNTPEPYMGMAQALDLKGRTADAIAQLQIALQYDPGDDRILSQINALQAKLPAPAPPTLSPPTLHKSR